MTFAWRQVAGPAVTLSNTAAVQPTFTAPAGGPAGVALEFELQVTDNGGLAGTDRVLINISNVNVPPTANAGPDQTVNSGSLVILDGLTSRDPDGAIASFAWRQVAGPAVTLSNPAAVQPTFTAPAGGPAGVALEFELQVTDNEGLAGTDRVLINVSNVNVPPTANAGPDQTVMAGALVTLDGSSSRDPDGTIVSFAWQQTAGTPVILSNPAAVQPTFTAPAGSPAGVALEFELRVTDDGGLTGTDRVLINVSSLNLNTSPIADAGPDQTVIEGSLVTLDGSASRDPGGAIATFAWTQRKGPAVALSNAAAPQPTFTAPRGGAGAVALEFELTVTDNDGLTEY